MFAKIIAMSVGGFLLALFGTLVLAGAAAAADLRLGVPGEVMLAIGFWAVGISIVARMPSIAKAWRLILVLCTVLCFMLPIVEFFYSITDVDYNSMMHLFVSIGAVVLGVTFLVVALLIDACEPDNQV